MKRMLLLLLTFAAGPLDEIEAARAAMPTHGPTAVYVSFLGTAQPDRDKLETAFSLALNGVTFRRKPIHLVPVPGKSQTLYRIDYEDLEWKAESVKALLLREPYFYPIAPDVPMMRADWFVKEGTFGQTYYDLLGMGKTLATLEKRVGLDRKTAENLRAKHGARVVESGVTINPRAIARLGSTLGAFWETDDASDAAKVNPFERIEQQTFPQADAHELFGPLPNGLNWWALANAKGELQNAAPTNIAADRRDYRPLKELNDCTKERPSYRVVEIQNPHSCMGCHAMGLRAAPDFVAGAVAGDKIEVKAYDKKTAGKIEDFFDARAQADAMTTDSLTYQRAVERITGKPPLAAGNIFAAVRWIYAEQNVSEAQAAAELNVDVKTFQEACKAGDDVRLAVAYWLLGQSDGTRAAQYVLGLDDEAYKAFQQGQAVPLGSSTLRALVTGTAIPRDLWEKAAYPEAALLVCYQQQPRAAITREMLRQRMKPKEEPPTKQEPPKQQVKAQRQRSTDVATGKPIELNDQGVWEFIK